MMWRHFFLVPLAWIGTIPRPAQATPGDAPANFRWLDASQWLTPHSYECSELLSIVAKGLVDAGDGPPWSPELRLARRKARDDFRAAFASYPKTSPLGTEQLHLLMEELDKYFFFGALTQGMEPLVDLEVVGGLSAPQRLVGVGRTVLDVRNARVKILIPRKFGEPRDPYEQVTSLLKEMAHSFMFFYWKPSVDQKEKEAFWGYNGRGYGPAVWDLFRLMSRELKDFDTALHSLAEYSSSAHQEKDADALWVALTESKSDPTFFVPMLLCIFILAEQLQRFSWFRERDWYGIIYVTFVVVIIAHQVRGALDWFP
ncbi:hypothetical protein JX266_006131 [Neoarthrinium moseri]|nr:hypothetical protein JX266_006131 [Neoarthrinium moseri]